MKRLIQKKFANTRFEPNFYSVYHELVNLPNIFDRAPVRCRKGSISCNPFFIIGSGRSGNTLLRAILMSNRVIAIPPESYVLGSLARDFQKTRYKGWQEISEWVISVFDKYPEFKTWKTNLNKLYSPVKDLPKNSRGLDKIIDLVYLQYINQNKPQAKRWGDKTPVNVFHLWWINQIFPSAQYIHIIRDGRDVVNSYLKSGIYTSTEKACERWLSSVEFSQKFGKQIGGDRYSEVRYEDLVKTPETEIKKICRFLKIVFNENMLFPQTEYTKLGDATQSNHHKNLKRPITSDSVEKWKRELSPSDQKTVSKLLSGALIKLGYE